MKRILAGLVENTTHGRDQQMVILIVEDEFLIGWTMRLILELGDDRVRGPAQTVAEALELANEERPDLALVDVDLDTPGGGLTVAKVLAREHGTTCVFVTGNIAQAHTARDAAIGVMAKPFDPEAVVGTVETMKRLRHGLKVEHEHRELVLFR